METKIVKSHSHPITNIPYTAQAMEAVWKTETLDAVQCAHKLAMNKIKCICDELAEMEETEPNKDEMHCLWLAMDIINRSVCIHKELKMVTS